MRIAFAQINSTVGDLDANAQKVIDFSLQANERGADMVIFPELAVTGYPPEDLLLKPRFVTANLASLRKIKEGIRNIIAVVGFVDRKERKIFNAAAVIYKQKIYGIYHKTCLPNYGVFDEKRYFASGDNFLNFKFADCRFGLLICEDIWEDAPVRVLTQGGAQIIFSLNSSPYHIEKFNLRTQVLEREARKNRVFIAYVNMVGGQDELVFDGRSMLVDANGKILLQTKPFQEDLVMFDINLPKKPVKKIIKTFTIPKRINRQKDLLKMVQSKEMSKEAEVYAALRLGLRDYVQKNRFQKVVVGLSGGIDSALTAALAVDTLEKENVVGVFMPSEFSSSQSQEDSTRLAKNLGIDFKIINIQEIFDNYRKILSPFFEGLPFDVAEENIQARIRGNILMALSNKFGWLVLTTGNKSEYSCGYATLYGDMAGGFAVLKDVPKTLVFELAKYRNKIAAGREIIPSSIITKEPSAELRPNQKDCDSLPPYSILDRIITFYVEERQGRDDIVEKIRMEATIDKVIRLIDNAEYKRRQSPPGIKITPLAFGRDWRMPITNRYKI